MIRDMRFRFIKHNQRHWRQWVLVLVLSGGFLTQAQTPARTPELGDASQIGLSAERELGDSIMAQVWRDPDLVDDPVLLEYVNGIWLKLLAAAQLRGDVSAEMSQRFAFEVVLIRDRSINAFALPGGYLGVHLGLIAATSSRDELASVLAHELSHMTQRHIGRMIGQENQDAPLVLGSMLLGLLAASRSPDAAGALMMGGQAATLQNQLKFSRNMEREADRIGFEILQQAGFDRQGAVGLFDKLLKVSRLNDSGALPYLRTHPLTTERIADMAGRAQPLKAGAVAPTGDKLHDLLAARARALSDTTPEAQSNLIRTAQIRTRAAPGSDAAPVGALYAGVLAAMHLREFERAQEFLAVLRKSLPEPGVAQDRVTWLEVELHLRQGQASMALTELARVSPASSETRAQKLLRWQALLLTQQAPQVRIANAEIDAWLARHPSDAPVWDIGGQGLGQVGETLRSLRARAEARALRHDLASAIDHLLAAQTEARELIRQKQSTRAHEIDAAIVDTRLQQLGQLQRAKMQQH